MLRTGFGKGGCIVRGIGCAPYHTIDGEPLQHGSTGVVGLLMPAGGGVMKQPFDAFVPKFLASLQEGARGNKGALARQQDIELIDELGHGDMAMLMMAQTSRSMGMRRQRRVATPSSASREVMSSGGMSSESDSN